MLKLQANTVKEKCLHFAHFLEFCILQDCFDLSLEVEKIKSNLPNTILFDVKKTNKAEMAQMCPPTRGNFPNFVPF